MKKITIVLSIILLFAGILSGCTDVTDMIAGNAVTVYNFQFMEFDGPDGMVIKDEEGIKVVHDFLNRSEFDKFIVEYLAKGYDVRVTAIPGKKKGNGMPTFVIKGVSPFVAPTPAFQKQKGVDA